MGNSFIEELKSRVLIGDGAMGTSIQERNLTVEDYNGHDGCYEYLVISRPDVITSIHESFLQVGADFVETNSFGLSTIVLGEYGLAAEACNLSRTAAQIARQAADHYSNKERTRYVSGSVGPTSKLPSLCQVDFDVLFQSYLPGMCGLLDGGIDFFQIETCQDLLQARCAVMAAYGAMEKQGRKVPICVTVTVDAIGTMLAGSDIATAIVVLESLGVDLIGLNCGTGPESMAPAVRILSERSATPIIVIPNAGLPRNESGQLVYDLSPNVFAEQLSPFVMNYGVACVGGCCGTTPAHIEALVNKFSTCLAPGRAVVSAPCLTSSFAALPLQPENRPLLVSERCNANGSKAFRHLLLKDDWDGVLALARHEIGNGADAIDLCVAYVGRSEIDDMNQIVWRCNSQLAAPLMLDSTDPEVLSAALKKIAGRSIINSVNFEDGVEKFDRICRLAKEYGTFLVALTIDEEGMAKTAEKKMDIAERIYRRAVEQHHLTAEQLLFDPLTFSLASGDRQSQTAAIETLQALKEIKRLLSGVHTILGISNISFGLSPYARRILNAVFLKEASESGLDACIIDPAKLFAFKDIRQEYIDVALDLIYARFSDEYNPLFRLIEMSQEKTEKKFPSNSVERGVSTAEILKQAVVAGEKTELSGLIEKLLPEFSPLSIINQILLPAMQEVGSRFAAGRMQLPFVLLSAETMKLAVKILEPRMERSDDAAKGKLLIATVKGDVHDIGKNLVDIIVSNNGFEVIDLGIKQPIEDILVAIDQHNPDAVGFSGLLVKSTLIMKENLKVMSERGIQIPVICGGAALTKEYVETDLQAAYGDGPVYYGADAFSGLKLMEELEQTKGLKGVRRKISSNSSNSRREDVEDSKSDLVVVSPSPAVPTPPFWGVRYVKSSQLQLEKIIPFINKRALYYRQWRFNTGHSSAVEQRVFIDEKVEPIFQLWCQKILNDRWLEPQVGYGYFPCQSEGNVLHIFDAEDKRQRLYSIVFPRQVKQGLCLADYFRSVTSGEYDLLALQIVTVGDCASRKSQELYAANEYSDYLYFHGLAVEFAEALAEYWHRQIRLELGIDDAEASEPSALFAKRYQGARYSFGYAACPNIEDQKLFFKLFDPAILGISLTSEYQLVPEQSTSAIIVHHPEAKYFAANGDATS